MLRIDRLVLAVVTQVPEWHPEHATFEPFPVHAWVIHHPDGPILFDTGIGLGHATIDGWYRPQVTPLPEALATVGVDARDVAAVVLSHLHFDHCGQHALVAAAPVHVQAAEVRAAEQRHYTIDEWAAIEPHRLRSHDGDAELAPGVRILSTPGHTPGHQSVVVSGDGDEGPVVLGGQCAFRAEEVRSGEPAATNLPDETGRDAARDSLARIRALRPAAVHLSHDPEVIDLRR